MLVNGWAVMVKTVLQYSVCKTSDLRWKSSHCLTMYEHGLFNVESGDRRNGIWILPHNWIQLMDCRYLDIWTLESNCSCPHDLCSMSAMSAVAESPAVKDREEHPPACQHPVEEGSLL